jgi:MFS-type transporter involved in bile tolerance (Atg22 family)
MKRSAREWTTYSLSILCAIAPFVAGLIRLVEARDLRLFEMAVAAFLGAVLIRVVGRTHRKPPVVLALSALTAVIAALSAASAAYALGATAASGIWLVAIVFGLSLAASYALDALSQPRST